MVWPVRWIGNYAQLALGGQNSIKSAAQLAFKLCLVPQNTEAGVAVAKGLSQLQFVPFNPSTTI